MQGRTAKRYADTPISRPGRSHESATGMTAFSGAAEGEPRTKSASREGLPATGAALGRY